MAKSQNQKLKIVYLMKILLEESDSKHPLTMNNLIDRLNDCGISAERKSLYDDIESLIVYGIDIIKEQKDRKHYYYVGNRDFSTPELKLLVDAVLSARFLTEEKSAELLQKISKLGSNQMAKSLKRQVVVRGRVKSMNQQVIENVDLLHEAIAENVQIAFDYCDWNEKKELVIRANGKKKGITPLKLLWDNENYYLVAYDKAKDGIRHYRVDKMKAICKCNEPGEGAEALKQDMLTEYSEQYFEMYDGDVEAVTLWVAEHLLGIMIDRFGTGITIRKANGGYEVRIKIAVSNVFLGWLIGLGGGVKILRPQSAADRMMTLVGTTIQKQQRAAVKNIIFDLGMVLVNFRYRDYCRDLGFSDETVDFFAKNIVLSDTWKLLDEGNHTEERVIELFIGKFPQYEKEIRQFFEDYSELVRPYEDSEAWIDEYLARGYQVYILTNYPDRMFDVHYKKQFPFIDKANGVFVSAKEKKTKPNREVYAALMEKFQLNPEECVFLDDSKVNVAGAEQFGIHAILVGEREKAKQELDCFLCAAGINK